MRAISAVLLSLAAYAAADASHCDPTYECKYLFENDASGTIWEWDFTPLCSASEYTYQVPPASSKTSIHFNVCGYAQQKCIPTEYNNPFQSGVAVQAWGAVPTCNPTAPACIDPSGNPICCTQDCELLGFNVPSYMPIDPNNPATGGINITHTAVPDDYEDPNQCPGDPITGYPIARTITYNVQCNPNGQRGALQVISFVEYPICQYTLTFSTVHGCAIQETLEPSNPGKTYSGGSIAGAFFGGILATVVIGGGVWYFLKRRGGGGFSLGSGSSGSSTGAGSGSGFGSGSGTAYSSVGGYGAA